MALRWFLYFPGRQPLWIFPEVLAGWNISKENFMSNVEFINYLKLRASYGQLGNDHLNIEDYGYLSTYSLTGVQLINDQVVQTL